MPARGGGKGGRGGRGKGEEATLWFQVNKVVCHDFQFQTQEDQPRWLDPQQTTAPPNPGPRGSLCLLRKSEAPAIGWLGGPIGLLYWNMMLPSGRDLRGHRQSRGHGHAGPGAETVRGTGLSPAGWPAAAYLRSTSPDRQHPPITHSPGASKVLQGSVGPQVGGGGLWGPESKYKRSPIPTWSESTTRPEPRARARAHSRKQWTGSLAAEKA